MFSTNPIIYQLQSLRHRIIKYVLSLNISVTHRTLMQIMQGLQQLLCDLTELQFGTDVDAGKAGSIDQLHH